MVQLNSHLQSICRLDHIVNITATFALSRYKLGYFSFISIQWVFSGLISSNLYRLRCNSLFNSITSLRYVLFCSTRNHLYYFPARYSFGWESQILETGFLAIFLCPVLSMRKIPRSTPPSIIVIWAFRWLIFRIMIGAVSIDKLCINSVKMP